MDKTLLRQAVLDKLNSELATLAGAALMAKEEATHEESRAESKYDTRGQEAAYLAEGQARLAAELHDSLTLYHSLPLPDFGPAQPIDLGAVVTLKAGARTTVYLLGPRNGGLEVETGGRTIFVVTPQSPLGRALRGRKAGDSVPLPGRSGPISHLITSVE